jgi:hypothetical protein
MHTNSFDKNDFHLFKIATNTQYMRKQLSHTLKQLLKEGKIEMDKVDRRIYLSLPSNESHLGHPVGEVSMVVEYGSQGWC